MTKTTNYNLNPWGAADKIKRADFNADNAKIDAALKTIANSASSAASAAAAAGNCQIYYTTRVGTDTTDAIIISVPRGRPEVIFLSNANGKVYMLACRGAAYAVITSHSNDVFMTWGDDYVRWRCSKDSSSNFNYIGTYHIYVLSVLE